MADAACDEALVLIEHLKGPRKLAHVLGSWIVGHRDSPELVQAVRLQPGLGRKSWRRRRAADCALREACSTVGARD